MGVAGELEQEVFFAVEMIEIVGLVDEGECRGLGGYSSEGAVGIRMSEPNEIESGDGQGVALDIEPGVLVDKKSDAHFFE